MRAVIQRVTSAAVSVDGKTVSQIGNGLLVLLGIGRDDTDKDRDYLIKKIIKLRIFPDEQRSFDKSVVAVGGEILLVSQFTLYGDCSKGNRPSFYQAMPPQKAQVAYDDFAKSLKGEYPNVQEGVFGAHMQISLMNDGPVTIVLDSCVAGQ